MSKYIVYNGEDYDYFATELEAMDYANKCIQNCLTGDGWYEEVESIFIAKIISKAKQYDCKCKMVPV